MTLLAGGLIAFQGHVDRLDLLARRLGRIQKQPPFPAKFAPRGARTVEHFVPDVKT
jgi:hypothetical protein